MTSDLNDQRYIVLSQKIVQNVKTRKDELELLLFDLTAEGNPVTDVTATEWTITHREPQSHEIDKMTRFLARMIPKD